MLVNGAEHGFLEVFDGFEVVVVDRGAFELAPSEVASRLDTLDEQG